MTAPAAPPPRPSARFLRGIGALIVLVTVVVGVPILMTAVHLAPHAVPSLHDIKHDLTSRDDGQLAIVAIAIGVWMCWALFTLSLIPELVAVVRKRPAYPLPGLGSFQRPASTLVAAIAIGFTVAPLVTGLGAGRASAAPPPPPGSSSPAATSVATPHLTSPSTPLAGRHTNDATPGTTHAASGEHGTPAQHPTYTVQRRDTLWQIAADHLGDPMRYTEIVALNKPVIGPDNTIQPGTRLRLPDDATGVGRTSLPTTPAGDGSTRVVIQPGDTLSGAVERVTGSDDWHPAWEHNKGRHETDGHVLSDPNLLWPGDVLDIPDPATGTQPGTYPPPVRHRPVDHGPTQQGPAQQPSHGEPGQRQPTRSQPTQALPAATTTPTTRHDHTTAQPDGHRTPARSDNRYLSLRVGGGILAAATFAALMVLRRRKFRHRRPGHVVASLPPDLMPLEQALVSAGRPALAKMTFFDLALRDLAARVEKHPAGSLPDVVGAAINDDYLELYLGASDGHDAAPPEPWLETAPRRWTLSREAELDTAASGRLAPYPCLVSIAYAEDGTEYLLDLEHAGALVLTGDPERCLDLGRYIVAELANNPWSDHLTVTVSGFARELLPANPTRLAYTDDAQTAAAALAEVAAENRVAAAAAEVDVLTGRLRGTDGDVWMPHVLLATSEVDDESVEMLRDSVAGGRAAVAVVLPLGRAADDSDGERSEQRPRLHLSDTGTLATDLLPVSDLCALGLPEADAPDLARAIALDRDGALDEPTPRADGGRACDAFADAAGALLPEFTLPRAASGPSAIDPGEAARSSVLPGPDAGYVSSAATTEEDLAELAPAVTIETRTAVEQADPELDKLVAAWLDPESQLARLRLLGQVTVTAFGRRPAKQEEFCTEIVAYLWTHPNGVSTDQFANDLWPTKNYTGTDSYPKDMASRVRLWLGVDPRTGREYWPRARREGVQGYRLDGLLCDVDLFRRLRSRGEARGVDGLPDLVSALDLVSGTPLSNLRPFGYGWLPAGDELLYQAAVSEVAHLVATHALEAGDDAAAMRACQLALTFNDEDDYALLQLVKAHERAGRDAEKDATIMRLRTLDDPPPRTLEVMRRNGWLLRGA